MRKSLDGVVSVFAFAVSTVLSLTATELVLRWQAGDQILSWTLTGDPTTGAHAWAHAQAMIAIPGVDPTWVRLSPRRVGDSGLRRIEPTGRVPSELHLESMFSWNQRLLMAIACGDAPWRDQLRNVPAPFYFVPVQPSIHPPYRFLPSVRDSSGLRTNDYGFRGPDIPLDKPSRTIRLAFAGASTTVNARGLPHSYPELVVYWLNLWAKQVGLEIHFDGLNAGRFGINSTDIAAVVRHEVVPFEPDFVVYYEGSNQFWPADFIVWPDGEIPARPALDVLRYSKLERYSRLARVVRAVWNRGSGAEPAKASYDVQWPSDLDEFDPDLEYPRLPLNLRTILKDLEEMKSAVESSGGELLVSSFVWLVHDGLRLRRPEHDGVYRYLNEVFGAFEYKDVRRMVDFQNRVFEKYSTESGLDFVDVARAYPADPRLFADAIHGREQGVRLRAWIVFRELTRIIGQRIAEGTLPRADSRSLERHPAGLEIFPSTTTWPALESSC